MDGEGGGQLRPLVPPPGGHVPKQEGGCHCLLPPPGVHVPKQEGGCLLPPQRQLKKVANLNKNAHKCLKVLVFLTMRMNSPVKTIQTWYTKTAI